MAQYNATLETMRGHVRRIKPNADPNLIDDWLNERVRYVIDVRPMWAGSIKHVVLAVPNAYQTGTITLTIGSNVITGASTAWPVSDVVNTTVTLAAKVGQQFVVPASMTGIDEDTVLYVDAAGDPEIVPVLRVTPLSFGAVFTKAHAAGFTVTVSSLAGRQLKQSVTSPIYTILAVTAAGSLIIDGRWGIATLAGSAYEILKMYYTVATDIKEWMSATDSLQNYPIPYHVPLETINREDPNRQGSGEPSCFVDMKPNLCGNMQYELYPPQRSARQIAIMYFQQWREMKLPFDRPPFFINPDLFTNGACAKALRTRLITDPKVPDPYYDPATAQYYDGLFLNGLQMAINADNEKAQLALTSKENRRGGGANYWQSHDPDADEMMGW